MTPARASKQAKQRTQYQLDSERWAGLRHGAAAGDLLSQSPRCVGSKGTDTHYYIR